MSRTRVLTFLTSLLLSGHAAQLQHLSPGKARKSQVISQPSLNQLNNLLLPISPPEPDEDEIPSFEIMDFYVPSYPFSGSLKFQLVALDSEMPSGDSIEMSCGYEVSDEFLFRRLEWYRVSHNHKVSTRTPGRSTRPL